MDGCQNILKITFIENGQIINWKNKIDLLKTGFVVKISVFY